MDRRGFLATLGTLAAAAALPPISADEWKESGRIVGQDFRLDSTLDLRWLPDDFIISDCSFRANPGFTGDVLVLLPEHASGLVTHCYFDGTNLPRDSYFFS